MSSTSDLRYDKATILLHWATAVVVIALWITGQVSDLFPKGPLQNGSWSIHLTLGFVFVVLLVWRIVWRGFQGSRLPPAGSGILQWLAEATHYALYALLMIVVTLGVVNAFVRGYVIFDIVHLPQIGDKALRKPITHWHGLGANILLGLALLHAGAALAHHYVLKDAVLKRMLPQRP